MAWWNPKTWFDGGASGRVPRAWRIIRAKFDSAQTTPDNRRHAVNVACYYFYHILFAKTFAVGRSAAPGETNVK